MSPQATDRRERVIDGGRAQSLASAVRALWSARATVLAFASRTIRLRYRQTVLGLLWVVIQPLALLVPFTLLLRRDGVDRLPYAATTLSALVGWQFLSSAVGNGAGSLVNEAVLIRRTWFPREAPVLGAVIAAGVDLAVGIVVAVIGGLVLGARFGSPLVAAPVAIAGLGVVAVALSLPLAAVNARYRDVRHALPFLLTLWMFATPVLFDFERIGRRWRRLYAALNPAAGPIDAMRRSMAGGIWPDWSLLATSVASAVVMGLVGHRLFRRIAPTLPDVI